MTCHEFLLQLIFNLLSTKERETAAFEPIAPQLSSGIILGELLNPSSVKWDNSMLIIGTK